MGLCRRASSLRSRRRLARSIEIRRTCCDCEDAWRSDPYSHCGSIAKWRALCVREQYRPLEPARAQQQLATDTAALLEEDSWGIVTAHKAYQSPARSLLRVAGASLSKTSWHTGNRRMLASCPEASARLNAFHDCQKQRWLQKRPGDLSSRERYAKNGRPHAMHFS
jgi:hypothetical protein